MKNGKPKLPLVGKDELNLIEVPFTLLTDSAKERQRTIEFTDRQKEIIRNWTITGSDKYGLPCAYDEPVYIAMLALTKKNEFRSCRVDFNPYELLQVMRWPTSSKYYNRVELALNRLTGVTIYTNFWWSRGEFKKRLKTVGFHILDNFSIAVGSKSNKNSYFKWNDVVFESFLDGNLKNLDLETYFGLRTPISKRFYRLWDKRLYKADQVSFDLEELCHEKLGISRNISYPSSLKQKLQSTLKEHQEKKLLSSARYHKAKNGNWMLNIKRYRDDPAPLPELPSPSAEAPKDNPLLSKLISLGIPNKKVLALLKEYPRQKIEAWVEAFPEIKPENPAGYLLKALSEDWALHPEAQKKLDEKKLEQEKRLQEEYNQYVLIQVEESLRTMDPEQLKGEIEEFKKMFMKHWGLDTLSPVWLSKLQQDFKWQKAKTLDLPTFEEWCRDNL